MICDGPQDLREAVQKQERTDGGRGGIGDGLRKKDPVEAGRHEVRQKISRRNEEKDLPEERDKERDLCLPRRDKGVLRRSLQPEDDHAGKKDRGGPADCRDKLRILSEQMGHGRGAEDKEQEEGRIPGDKDQREHPEGGLQALRAPVTVLVGEDRDAALGKALERDGHELHAGLQDGKSRDVEIPELCKLPVQDKTYD